MEAREKITLFLILIFFFFCIIFSQNQKANARRSLNSFSENDPLTQFNQTSSINITGVASTLDQATIDSYLNVNGDGLTWDVTEAPITLAPLRNSTMGGDTGTNAWETSAVITQGTAAYGYNTTGGNPAPSYYHKATSTASAAASITFYTNQSFYYDGSPAIVTLSWDYQVIGNSIATTGNQLSIILYRPDGTSSILDSVTFSGAVDWTRRTINVNPANFTQAGTYVIQLKSTLVAAAKGTDNWLQAQYDNVFLNFTKYQVSVEHNTTISYSGILNSINVSINFTSTVDDTYNMTIYDFANSKWDASPCQNISAIANNYYTIWCNVTSNPTNYVSSDNKVRVRLNSTVDNDQSTLKEEYIQFYISYLIGYLEVELIQPNPEVITNIAQNSTFLVNATVFCREGPCGYINGTLMYNLTSPYPDTPINISFGDKPFFVNESPPQATKACPNNPLNQGDFCNLTWIVNTTGDVGTNWKIGVLFNSSLPEVGQNHTSNATVSIVAIMEGLSISWNSIDFGFLIPNTQAENNPAPGNSYDLYNITNTGSCSLQLWIKGTDLVNSTLNSSIAVGNLSWSNSSKVYNPSTVYPLDYSYKLLYNSLSPGSNLTTYYWLSVPSVYAGVYKGTITICGNCSSSCD
jgi:hypothetical protein